MNASVEAKKLFDAVGETIRELNPTSESVYAVGMYLLLTAAGCLQMNTVQLLAAVAAVAVGQEALYSQDTPTNQGVN